MQRSLKIHNEVYNKSDKFEDDESVVWNLLLPLQLTIIDVVGIVIVIDPYWSCRFSSCVILVIIIVVIVVVAVLSLLSPSSLLLLFLYCIAVVVFLFLFHTSLYRTHLCPLDAFFVPGVGVGIASIQLKAITLAPPFRWADAIYYFFSH